MTILEMQKKIRLCMAIMYWTILWNFFNYKEINLNL